MSSNKLQAAKVYLQLLKAVKKHVGNEDYKVHFSEYVTQEFRKNRNLSDPSSLQQKIKLAHDYTFLLNSVHHHKARLFTKPHQLSCLLFATPYIKFLLYDL